MEASLINIETPTYRRETQQRSVAAPSSEHVTPEPLADLSDLPGSSSAPILDHPLPSRSRVENQQHQVIDEEDDEEEDNTPPLSFSS